MLIDHECEKTEPHGGIRIRLSYGENFASLWLFLPDARPVIFAAFCPWCGKAASTLVAEVAA